MKSNSFYMVPYNFKTLLAYSLLFSLYGRLNRYNVSSKRLFQNLRKERLPGHPPVNCRLALGVSRLFIRALSVTTRCQWSTRSIDIPPPTERKPYGSSSLKTMTPVPSQSTVAVGTARDRRCTPVTDHYTAVMTSVL